METSRNMNRAIAMFVVVSAVCAPVSFPRSSAFPVARAFDEHTTHPALTQEIAAYYNLLHPASPLSSEEKEWMIEGSIAEDQTPRWINHFYDPVHERGWTGSNAGSIPQAVVAALARIGISSEKPYSAIEWAHNGAAQEAYRSFGGNHTWERGLLSYREGDRAEAYRTLGHIVHLLEDMAVPDHTRDDTHAHDLEAFTGDPGSPHELYAMQWTRETIGSLALPALLMKEGAEPPALVSLDDHLRAMATYTNKYFFSADTIGSSDYPAPRIVREDEQFAYGRDENGKEFPLASVELVQSGSGGRAVKAYRLLEREEYYPMFKEQFVRVARQVMLHGAGVVALFEDAARVADGQARANASAANASSGIGASVPPVISIAGFVSNVKNIAVTAASALRTKASDFLATARATLATIMGNGAGDETISVGGSGSPAGSAGASSAKKTAKNSVGKTTSAKKTTPKTISVALPAARATSSASAAKPSSTLILQKSVPLVPASPIASKPATAPLAPTVVSGGGGTGGGSGGAVLVPNTSVAAPESSATSSASSMSAPSSSTSGTPRVVISEIQVEGADDAGDEFIELYNAGDGRADMTGWSLQYLSGGSDSLTQTKKKNVPDGAAIAPGSYYFIARALDSAGKDGYRGSVTPDLTHRTIAMSGAATGGTVFIVTNAELIDGPADPDIADRVGYGTPQVGFAEGAPAPVPKKGAWIERKALRTDGACIAPADAGAGNGCDTNNNAADFVLHGGAVSSAGADATSTAPIAPALSIAFVSSSMSATFSWDAVADGSGSTSSTRYALYDLSAPSGSAPIFEAAGELTHIITIDEVGRTYRFGLVADINGTSSAIGVASLDIPSFVRDVHFYRDPNPDSQNYFADVMFDTAPFIPARWSGFAGGPIWQGLVFYFDRVPARENFVLTTQSNFAPQNDTTGVVPVIANSAEKQSFIFTFNSDFHSEIGGGLKQESVLVAEAAGHFTVSLVLPADVTPTAHDYLTAAYYDFSRVGGGTQDLSLVAIDGTKYYFDSSLH